MEGGEVISQCAPCMVRTIDPEYIRVNAQQRRSGKFRMKTDILILREITRIKFMGYATQQRYFEKQREVAHEGQIYRQMADIGELVVNALRKSEASIFAETKDTQQKLENLGKTKISQKLKKELAEYQQVLTDVQEVYGRFLFLLKLIGHFDDIIAEEDMESEIKKKCELPQLTDVVNLQIGDRKPIKRNDISSITIYMNKIVAPYLEKKNFFKPDIWIKVYERTRQKIFNYNRHLQQLVLLYHLVGVVNDRSKHACERSVKETFLKDADFLISINSFLSQRSLEVVDNFTRSELKDLIQMKMNVILPVCLKNIESKMVQSKGYIEDQILEDKTRLQYFSKNSVDSKSSSTNSNLFNSSSSLTPKENVEKLQWYLMGLLEYLERVPHNDRKEIERQVRSRAEALKKVSRRVLLKQNRLHNWMKHFKKHDILLSE